MGVFEDVMAQTSRRPEGFSGVLDRRRTKRVPTLRASTAGMTTHLWELELVPAFGLPRLLGDIEQLSKRSLDGNIFFEADIVKSAWPRLTSLLAPQGCWMLCLWETIGEERRLRVFMPVRLTKTGLPAKTVLEALSNDYMPKGTPLVDAECAGEAVETLLRLLADPQLGMPAVFDFTHQIDGSRTLEVICDAAASLGLQTIESGHSERAALFANDTARSYPDDVLPRKRVRDYARQLRRLEELGEVRFHCARDEEEVLDAFEDFITLELRSWKGRRGTALYNQKNITSFSRQIVAEMALRRHSEIFYLTLDGRTIASLIMLGRDGYGVPWKMAFDERLKNHSPGVQVMLKATEQLLARETFAGADSLAVSDHWMMNRLWPDRIKVVDVAVQLRPDTRLTIDGLIAAKERRQRLFALLKRGLARWRKS